MNNGYLLEKAVYALRPLADIAQSLKEGTHSEEELKDFVEYQLHYAIFNLTKIASSVTETQWTTNDAATIFADPIDGLETLLVKYGWLKSTSRQQESEKLNNFLLRSVQLLNDPNRAPARTLLHELIDTVELKYPEINRMSAGLERVHMGELSWDDFRSNALVEVSALLELVELKDTIAEQEV